jgi:DNA-binding NtrC family response regulator
MDEPIVVLVVDDDVSIQTIVEDALGDGGFASKLLHQARRP